MFQKLLASKHYRLRDSKSRPRLGRAKDLVWSPTKLKKQETAVRLEPRFKTHGYSHCPTALLLFFIFMQTLVQLVKRDMVTAVIYCYITTEFHYAKRDSLPFTLAGFLCKFWQVLLRLSHFDEPKNSLELANPTRNIRLCSTKLMTITSGEINLQSKRDIICHVAKVKPATSADYLADVIPFLSYVIFPSNPTLR